MKSARMVLTSYQKQCILFHCSKDQQYVARLFLEEENIPVSRISEFKLLNSPRAVLCFKILCFNNSLLLERLQDYTDSITDFQRRIPYLNSSWDVSTRMPIPDPHYSNAVNFQDQYIKCTSCSPAADQWWWLGLVAWRGH